MTDFTDGNGYPTDAALEIIRRWKDFDNVRGWFEFIRPLWRFGNHGFWVEEVTTDGDVYTLHTGGWSGNEDLIQAMRENWLWPVTFVSEHRGGHFTLIVPHRFRVVGRVKEPVAEGAEPHDN